MRLTTLAVFVATSLGAVVARAGAQEVAKETVSLEFFNATLRTSSIGADGVRIMPGAMPSNVERQITFPPGTRILGSLLHDNSTDVIAVVPLGTDSAHAMLGRALAATGWRPPRPSRSGGGLQYSTPIDGTRGLYCRGDTAYASIAVAPHAGAPTGSDVRVTFTSDEATPCAANRPSFAGPPPRDVMQSMPPLYAPSGASSMSCYGDGVMSSSSSAMIIATTLAPDAVFAHYDSQLVAAGWKPEVTQRAIIGSWSKPDSADGVQHAVLSIQPEARKSGCYELSLRVTLTQR